MKTTVTTAPQGIMTVEAGAITGEVVIATEETSGGVAVTAAYEGAEDVYTVEGSPTKRGADHEEIVAALTEEHDKANRLG